MAAQSAMTETELEEFLAAIPARYPSGQRNLALLTLLADAGLRVSEGLGIDTRDLVRADGGRVVTHVHIIGKGGKRATMPVSARAAARLDTWLQSRAALGITTGPVFCTVSTGQASGYAAEGATLTPGRRVSARYVQNLVARTARKAGIEGRITPHTLRHTFATHLFRHGASLEAVRVALRHSRTSTTADVYSHLVPSDIENLIRDLHAGPPATGEPQTVRLTPELRAALRALLATDTE